MLETANAQGWFRLVELMIVLKIGVASWRAKTARAQNHHWAKFAFDNSPDEFQCSRVHAHRSLLERRGLVLLIGAAAFLLLLFVLWPATRAPSQRTPAVVLADTNGDGVPDQPIAATPAQSEATLSNFVSEAKSRIQGGIGVILSADPTNGLPRVMGVTSGSPAEAAGLQRDDLITHAGGKPLLGLPLKQVIDSIRGFTKTSLDLVVIRPPETNTLNIRIRRTSFKSLGVSP